MNEVGWLVFFIWWLETASAAVPQFDERTNDCRTAVGSVPGPMAVSGKWKRAFIYECEWKIPFLQCLLEVCRSQNEGKIFAFSALWWLKKLYRNIFGWLSEWLQFSDRVSCFTFHMQPWLVYGRTVEFKQTAFMSSMFIDFDVHAKQKEKKFCKYKAGYYLECCRISFTIYSACSSKDKHTQKLALFVIPAQQHYTRGLYIYTGI